MPFLVFVVFIITFFGCLLWVLLIWHFAKLLKAEQPTVYESLGSPMTSFFDLFGNKPMTNKLSISWKTTPEQNAASIRLVIFILLGKFNLLNVTAIKKLGTFMRILFFY